MVLMLYYCTRESLWCNAKIGSERGGMLLYALYESQRAALMPARILADHAQHWLRNPYNPFSYTPAARIWAAACDVFEHATRRYGKPPFGLDAVTIAGREAPVTEEHLGVKVFGRLKHFRRAAARAGDPRVLLVAPLSGHFATLLRGTVAALLPDHDVFITDWRDARMIPAFEGEFGLDDYIDYVIDWLRLLGPETHVVAVCQPSVPVLAALALMEEDDDPALPRSATFMGGPIDTRINPTVVNEFAKSRPLSWFARNVITRVPPLYPGAGRRVYPGFLQLAGFMAMNVGDHMVKHYEFFQHLVEGDGESAEATRAFYEEYRAVMDLPARFYLETVERVFQRHLLPRGLLVHRGRRIDVAAIRRTPIMAIEGERDDISGIGQTRAVLDLARNLPDGRKAYLLARHVGHYGIFNGRRWREEIAPALKAFIRRHDG